MRLNRALVLGLALGVCGLTAARAGTAASVTGTWKSEFTNQNGDKIETTYKFKQDGEKLTGVVIRNDNEAEIKDGKVKDSDVSFKIVRERDGNTFTIKYSGKLEGDTIKGKVELEINGEDRMFDWEAKRAS